MEISKRLAPTWFDVEYNGETVGFLLAPLTSFQKVSVKAAAEDDTGVAAKRAIELAVRDWRGFTRDGEAVKFSAAELDALFAAAQLWDLALVVGREIINRTQLKEADAKN